MFKSADDLSIYASRGHSANMVERAHLPQPSAAGPLNADQIKHFQEKGFVVLRGLVNEAEVNAAMADK